MTLNDLLTEIWGALAKPAESYTEITDRINITLAAKGLPAVSRAQVSQAIYWLRHADPAYYGWTIPHCKRGPAEAGRLVRIVVNATGAPLTVMKREAVQAGALGTVRHVSTIMDHGVKMMNILTPQLPHPKLRRIAKAMGRKMKFIAEEAVEMEEALIDQKWG